MTVPAGAVYIGGVACTPDGAVYVTPTGTAAITGGNTKFVLARWTFPFIVAGTGSIGNNGALTLTTALTTQPMGGAYVYFPAGAIVTASTAGWYWTTFSSTTAGTIWNSVYTTGIPTAGTQTAFVTTGPGAYTGIATAQGVTIPIAANQLGATGSIFVEYKFSATNTGSSKTVQVLYSGSTGAQYLSETFTTQLGFVGVARISNANVTNAQTGFSFGSSLVNGVFGMTQTSSADTTGSTSVFFGITKVAADNAQLDFGMVEIVTP